MAYVVIYSTGLKVCGEGEGEWQIAQVSSDGAYDTKGRYLKPLYIDINNWSARNLTYETITLK